MLKKIGVSLIHPMKDKQHIYAFLKSSEWGFGEYGLVNLIIGDSHVKMKYIGTMNANNTPVLVLSPQDSTYRKVEDIAALGNSDMFVERIREE